MADGTHWGYDGEVSPEFWGHLDPAFVMCGIGKQQSPIDISVTDVVPAELSTITFHYAPTQLNIVNNGHSIQINCDPGSYIEIGDERGDARNVHRFELLQFHFHTLSEHTYNGKYSDLEVHLVHQNKAGRYAVVGVMFDVGEENPALSPIWARMPAASGPEQQFAETVNPGDLLPDDWMTFRYDGSLTTPPCSENVLWVMMATPLTVSKAQVAAFAAIFPNNYRPVQPLNGRVIKTDVAYRP